MPPTKRKRRATKHRGNAAGMVETRGRTGRKPTSSERKAAARQGRADRFSRPPTWRGSFNRALIAVAIFVVVIVFLIKQSPAVAIGMAAFMLVVYTPLGYYTDLYLYRRRQAKKLAEQGRR